MNVSQKQDYLRIKEIIDNNEQTHTQINIGNNLTDQKNIVNNLTDQKNIANNLTDFAKKTKLRLDELKKDERINIKNKNIPTSGNLIKRLEYLNNIKFRKIDNKAYNNSIEFLTLNHRDFDEKIRQQFENNKIEYDNGFFSYYISDKKSINCKSNIVELKKYIEKNEKIFKEKYKNNTLDDNLSSTRENIGELNDNKIYEHMKLRYDALEQIEKITSIDNENSNVLYMISGYKTVKELEEMYELKNIYPGNVVGDIHSIAYLEKEELPDHKVLWLTDRDCLYNIDKKEYMPEFRYYESKLNSKDKKEYDYYMQKFKMCVIGMAREDDELKPYEGYFEIKNTDIKNWLESQIPKILKYSVVNNKIFIQNVVTRRLCFPMMAIIDECENDPKDTKFGKCKNTEICGMFILTLGTNIHYPYFIKSNSEGKFIMCNAWNTETFFDSMISNRIRELYVEINVAINTMKNTGNKQCYIYNVLNDDKSKTSKFLFSRYDLERLHKIYEKKGLDEYELKKLININYEKVLYNGIKIYPMFLKQSTCKIQKQTGGKTQSNNAITIVKQYIFDIKKYKNKKLKVEKNIDINKVEKNIDIDIDIDTQSDKNHNYESKIKVNLLTEKIIKAQSTFLSTKKKYDVNIKKYASTLFHIKNYILRSFKVDERQYPYDFINNTTILKTKLISWDIPLFPMIILNYMQSLFTKNIMAISRNYAVVEMLIYYQKKMSESNSDFRINFDHYHYTKNTGKFNTEKIQTSVNSLINKIKTTYEFNDYHIDTIPKKKYGFMLCDVINDRIYDDIELDINLIINIEKENNKLLDYVYKKMEWLELNGDMLLYSYSFLTEENIQTLEKISKSFKKIKTFNNYGDAFWFPFIYCQGFNGKVDQLNDHISERFYKFVKHIYKKNIEKINTQLNVYSHIENLLLNDPTCDELQQMYIKNLYISNEIAEYIGLETYKFKGSMNIELSKNLQNLFSIEHAIEYTLIPRNNEKFIIEITDTDTLNIKEMDDINKYHLDTILMIDFRPKHIYDYVKKYVRLYEGTLNKLLFKNGININGSPVSRAWIKMLEILHIIDFKNINNIKDSNIIKTFHICEAPGNFVHCINYYINKYMKNVSFEWHALTLRPDGNNKNAFGDNYGMIKKNPNNWSYGFDNTGDITVRPNIEYYKDKCSTCDWLIGDCGMSWDPDPNNKKMFVRLYYAQILFILHNIRKGGNFIFKGVIPIDNPILIDAYYILYNSMEKMQLIKPVQNKFSPEFYIIGYNFKGSNLTDKDWDILFEALDDTDNKIDNISIISNAQKKNEKYSDNFKYQFIKGIGMISDSFCDTIRMQLFYVDFWNSITNDIKQLIKNTIHIKNEEFMKEYDIFT